VVKIWKTAALEGLRDSWMDMTASLSSDFAPVVFLFLVLLLIDLFRTTQIDRFLSRYLFPTFFPFLCVLRLPIRIFDLAGRNFKMRGTTFFRQRTGRGGGAGGSLSGENWIVIRELGRVAFSNCRILYLFLHRAAFSTVFLFLCFTSEI
jgi:hypothetical protein